MKDLRLAAFDAIIEEITLMAEKQDTDKDMTPSVLQGSDASDWEKEVDRYRHTLKLFTPLTAEDAEDGLYTIGPMVTVERAYGCMDYYLSLPLKEREHWVCLRAFLTKGSLSLLPADEETCSLCPKKPLNCVQIKGTPDTTLFKMVEVSSK